MQRQPRNEINASKLKNLFLNFSKKRGWEKKYFPNELAKSLVIESAELLEIFQRKDNKESLRMLNDLTIRKKLSDEIVDVLYYLLMLTHTASINLEDAIYNKLEALEKKYPIANRNARKGS